MEALYPRDCPAGYMFFDRLSDHATRDAGVKMSLFPHLVLII